MGANWRQQLGQCNRFGPHMGYAFLNPLNDELDTADIVFNETNFTIYCRLSLGMMWMHFRRQYQ